MVEGIDKFLSQLRAAVAKTADGEKIKTSSGEFTPEQILSLIDDIILIYEVLKHRKEPLKKRYFVMQSDINKMPPIVSRISSRLINESINKKYACEFLYELCDVLRVERWLDKADKDILKNISILYSVFCFMQAKFFGYRYVDVCKKTCYSAHCSYISRLKNRRIRKAS